MSQHPTIGIEEEFLLVDAATGAPVARNTEVAHAAAQHGVDLQLELTTCQVETATPTIDTSAEAERELSRLRRVAAEAAQANGARLLAVGLPPTVPHEFPITDKPRYRQIADRFGMIAHEQGICGCHVHVAVPDREAAVAVSNHLRPALPWLLALSANSAIYRNADTGYASWRSVLWHRWPSAGPPPHFDSADDYDATVATMLEIGAMLDDGMVYWDVRPSEKFPTVEVRVADVPATVTETVLLSTLIRAAVMAGLAAYERGEAAPSIPEHVLRATYWKCARDGVEGSTPQALTALVQRLAPQLEALGEYDRVRDDIDRITQDGNGAMRQRRAWRVNADVADVIDEAARATLR